ncbi:hypothetical protein DdX_22473 [Ditylenchus destructor]|uniref:Uncharacterized protein n=1 Tax=Ditylenchus destructor TaxID=166010 RepID=A0AAD4MDJ8_9BILA|nr:hypothetical protein DdX_22473 [Ditylenchus destructor]
MVDVTGYWWFEKPDATFYYTRVYHTSPVDHCWMHIVLFDYYISNINYETVSSIRFRNLRYKTSMTIQNLHDMDFKSFRAWRLLRAIFQQCIDVALDNARDEGQDADRIGVAIITPKLERNIYMTPFQITDSSAGQIYSKFHWVELNSNRTGPREILRLPFTIEITTLEKRN